MKAPTFLEAGEVAEYTRRIDAEDIAAFARISGDDDPVHTDADFAARTAFGRCIAHGAHVMGLLSTTASMMSRRSVARGATGTPVSAGYDRIRFTRPVFAGDTLTARYVIEEVDDGRARTRARLEVVNQDGATCLVGTHVLAWVMPA
ncbi:MaoC family dehydratase [Neoroseomonas oryzicola]|uniref:Dehydratase n=1 Tax=Neoroseomonas oryzicola TaxID=535904 RepID=A0A9X9WC86_9PROT|nr:MaoC/PaaZ C-terminal domain-containing protein [Neoroseomonas oryzicola]MBR0657946.1 dehydratase [Neoroseomonas oryzicola]NKE18736.1 dehydratase [Neoroseomonas oryzicola]